jgi:hypothetical protein
VDGGDRNRKGYMKSKSLFVSKSFWLNVLGVGASLLPNLPISHEALGYIMAGLNIVLRTITTGPVTVLPTPEDRGL